MILFDNTSVSNVSRLLRARDNEILVIRACLPEGVTLGFETGRLPAGALPSSDGSCAGVVCAPYDATLQDVCVLKVCCTAQTMDSCSNLVLLPPFPGYFRVRLLPLEAVGTVNVFAESIAYAAADIFPQRYWLGECPVVPPAPPDPSVNLAITNVCLGPSTAPEAENVDLSYGVVVSNAGPAAAVNATVTYVPTFSNSANISDPVLITYGGGASGPPSATWAELAAGIVLPAVPVGGTATLSPHMDYYGFNTDQETVATVAASVGQTDTNLANNTATAVCNPLRIAACCINIENVVVSPNPVPAGASFTVDADFVNCGGADLLAGFATLSNLPVGVTAPLGVTVTWPGIPVVGFVHRQFNLVNEAETSQALNMLLTAEDSCMVDMIITDTQIVPVSVIGTDPQANLSISKTASAPSFVVGALGSYTIFAANAGPASADGGTISDTLPPNAVITVGAGPYAVTYGGGASGPATTSFPLTVTTWPSGGTVSIAVPFTAAAAGSVENTATVAPPVGTNDPTPGNNTSTVTIAVTAPPAPRTVDISTVKAGNDSTTGVNEVFHNIYTNNGPDNANGLTVIDIPGTGYGSRWSLSTIAGVSITYTGGAAGPASATVAQLLAGIAIPTWPNGGQVNVAYSIHGDVAGTPNENCANVVAPPGITISDPIGAEFCLPFLVTGTSNCSCSATYDVTPLNRTVGQDFTATYTLPPSGDLSCCNTVDFHTISYPTEQDAIDDTNGTDTVALATVTCLSLGTSGSFPFVAGTAGWFRYYIDVLNNGSPQPQFCSISDSNQVFGNAPLPSKHTIAISGTWTYHTIT